MHERQWKLEVDDLRLRLVDPEGATRVVEKTALRGVIVETNDSGPWGADVWWLLFAADDRVALAFPQGASGEADVLDYLCALPGFDYEVMTQAMTSVENAVFPVWRKPD